MLFVFDICIYWYGLVTVMLPAGCMEKARRYCWSCDSPSANETSVFLMNM